MCPSKVLYHTALQLLPCLFLSLDSQQYSKIMSMFYYLFILSLELVLKYIG